MIQYVDFDVVLQSLFDELGVSIDEEDAVEDFGVEGFVSDDLSEIDPDSFYLFRGDDDSILAIPLYYFSVATRMFSAWGIDALCEFEVEYYGDLDLLSLTHCFLYVDENAVNGQIDAIESAYEEENS